MTIHGPAKAMMNPLVEQWLGSVLRHVLTGLGAVLMARAVVSPEGWHAFIEAAVPIILGLGWAGWQKFRARQKLVVAQAVGTPVTEKQVDQIIRQGDAPSTTLSKTETPSLQVTEAFKGTAP